jgi:hypothetical protein
LIADNRHHESNSKAIDFDFGSFDTKHRHDLCLKLKIESPSLEIIRPCTSVQAGMVAQFIRFESKMYYNSFKMHIRGVSNLRKLQLAWSAVFSRHQMLRTGFASTSDPQYPFALLTYRASDTNIPWTQQSKDYELGDEARNVLETLHRPAWRLFVKLVEEEDLICLRFAAHHALFDAQSLSMIFHDVAKSFSGQDLFVLAPIEPTLSDILIENVRDDQEISDYWKTRGDQLALTRFPNLCPLRVQSSESLISESLCSIELAELKNSCKNLGITLQALFQASWGRLLLAYTGEEHVSFGTVLSGRISSNSENVAFPTVVTLPTSAHAEGTNLDLVKALVRENAAVLKHQFTSLKRIQNWTGHQDQALFDTILAYQKEVEDITNFPWEIVGETATADVS